MQIPLLNWRSTAIEKLNLAQSRMAWVGTGGGIGVDEGWHGGMHYLTLALAFVPGG